MIYPMGENTNTYVETCWTSEREQIKLYFKREILSLIEKGERYCGIEPSGPCPNCYCYKEICHFHEELGYVTFEELKKAKNDINLIINPLLSYYDYNKITGDLYIKIYSNWRERINTFIWNQSRQI